MGLRSALMKKRGRNRCGCVVRYFQFVGSMHDQANMFLVFTHVWLMSLYAQSEGDCRGAVEGNSVANNSAHTNGQPTLAGWVGGVDGGAGSVGGAGDTPLPAMGQSSESSSRFSGCSLDIGAVVLVGLTWTDVLLRILDKKWANFWYVNDDFYTQMRNRYDFFFTALSLISVVLTGVM